MPTDVFRDPFMAAEDEKEIYNILTMEVMTILHECAAEYGCDNNKNTTPQNKRREAISNDEECSETGRPIP